MLGIVITGHGTFASGLLQAVEQIIGKQPGCIAVDFPDGMTTEQLYQALYIASKVCDLGKGGVFLTDLLGGSPFRQAAQLALTHPQLVYPHWQVITGTNMQLAVEMMIMRDEMNTIEFRDKALECGRRGLTSLWHEQQQSKQVLTDVDGI
ncbi:PTS galactosamine/N-acetylgalactosamine transporter subunit IIA [Xenorhabdus cabanillasii]|uniref:N-acetylgalactosamine-specific PTS system, EIIA component n=1 Tax=Xenorhabdus cabanillasii JM26 TaxID=1427517 RepID=W1IPA2_9GAMM|nr:PTS galactosamine/N-acetylgalactosamine transporter subunit IIA [Xenorhabdus cabanillasii]PHM77445.1 PTS system transporter subunit IIA [Xenorhabdus cabanillasii JM26]CDL79663.1 N-acetylgalactosamine-specific PTS system, EIIA component [Xenorhabdus cabanillasii JM26]